MKQLVYLLVLVALMMSSCQAIKQTSADSKEVVFKLSKSAGRGTSPSYVIELYHDGKAVLNGRKNIDPLGKYTKNIGKKRVASIRKAFDNANFFDFEDEYTAMITDLPTTYISYTSKEASKRIRDYYGAPKELKALEKMIEEIVDEGDWQKME